jgi:hypothetical protein
MIQSSNNNNNNNSNGTSITTGFGTRVTYTATELPGVASNLTAAAFCGKTENPNGVFVMIEPGTPDGFHSIRSVRTMLLVVVTHQINILHVMNDDDEYIKR